MRAMAGWRRAVRPFGEEAVCASCLKDCLCLGIVS